jgi:glycosyltransferase involved in cell wall biosynthesis
MVVGGNPARLAILFVVPYFEDAWGYGGIPRASALLAHALAARGHQVTVCTTDAGSSGARARPRPADGLDVQLFPNLSNRAAYHWQLFLPVGLDRFLRRNAARFDVAHIHGLHHLPGALAARRLLRAGVPFVLQPHGTAPRIERRRALKWLFDVTVGGDPLGRAARVLAVSAVERAGLERLGVGPARLVTVTNPVETPPAEATASGRALRRRLGLDDSELIVFLGKMTPRKRVDVLIRAFAALAPARPGLRLLVAGNDLGAGVDLPALAARLGVGPRVHFAGLVTGAERFAVLAAADLVAYPSAHEVFGLVPLEALGCGTPVLVSDDSGAAEVLAGLGGGRAVPVGSAAALAAALAEMLDALASWRAAAARARPLVPARHDAGVVAAALEPVYRDVVAGRVG